MAYEAKTKVTAVDVDAFIAGSPRPADVPAFAGMRMLERRP